MAIQKTKTLPNGTSGNYWKITQVLCNKQTKVCSFEISLYLTKELADAGAPPLSVKKVFSSAVSAVDMTGNMIALGYTTIKAQAAAMVKPPFGSKDAALVQYDPDLVGGTDV